MVEVVHIMEGMIVRIDQLRRLVKEMKAFMVLVKERVQNKCDEFQKAASLVVERAYDMLYEGKAANYLVIGNPYGANVPKPYYKKRSVTEFQPQHSMVSFLYCLIQEQSNQTAHLRGLHCLLEI